VKPRGYCGVLLLDRNNWRGCVNQPNAGGSLPLLAVLFPAEQFEFDRCSGMEILGIEQDLIARKPYVAADVIRFTRCNPAVLSGIAEIAGYDSAHLKLISIRICSLNAKSPTTIFGHTLWFGTQVMLVIGL
jgi:hypothetical protein